MAALTTEPSISEPPADLWSAAGTAMKIHAAAPAIVSIHRTGELPLSHSQERLHFLMQSGHNDPHYQIHLAWRLAGRVSPELLQRSLRAIIERHEILRTVFSVRDGKPVAEIRVQPELAFRMIDLENLEAAERDAESVRQANEEIRRPFDLSAGPLLRAALFRIDGLHYLFVITVCQIVFDGWSMRVISRELREFYAAFATGGSSPFAALPFHWADFVDWQTRGLAGPWFTGERDYWRKQLAAPYTPLPLPLDETRRFGQTASGTKRPWSLPRELTRRLHAIARQEGSTDFTALLAAIQGWLGCLTGKDDILVFASTFARDNKETQALIGLFANVLPLRTDLSGNPAFCDVIRRAHPVVLGGFAHPSVPFQEMIEALPVNAGSRDPLFQVMLVHQKSPLPVFEAGGVTFAPTQELHTGTAKFDLLFDLAESEEGLKGTITYRSDLFRSATIQALLDHLESFVSAVTEAPERAIRETCPALDSFTDKTSFTRVAREQSPDRTHIAPRNAIERKLCSIWERIFDRAPIGIGDNFFELGGGSLLAVRLVAEIAHGTGTRLPLSSLLEAPTIEKQAGLLAQAGAIRHSSLAPIRRSGTKPPIFCISGAGGSVLLFHTLAQHLDQDQPVYGLEPPELDGEQPVLASVEEIAAHYIRGVQGIQPRGPYHLVGFSFGGLVAFEMAQQLRSSGEEIGALILLDAYQNTSGNGQGWVDMARQKFRIYQSHVQELLRSEHRARRFKQVVGRKGLKVLYRFYTTLGRPVPPAIAATGTTEDMQVFARTQYQPRPYPGAMTLLRARIRPESEICDYDMGWGKFAAGRLEIDEVPGDHHSMAVAPNVRQLAARITVCLTRTQENIATKEDQEPV